MTPACGLKRFLAPKVFLFPVSQWIMVKAVKADFSCSEDDWAPCLGAEGEHAEALKSGRSRPSDPAGQVKGSDRGSAGGGGRGGDGGSA